MTLRSALRQVLATAAFAGAILHLCIGLKFAVFHGAFAQGHGALAVEMILLGLVLWSAGCQLAGMGHNAIPALTGSHVVPFSVTAHKEQPGSCPQKAAA